MRQVQRVAREIADCLPLFTDGPHRDRLQRWLLLLSPPKKKRRPKDPIRAARKTTVKELDALCRKIVFARDGGKCRRCGKADGLLDWAHVLSRRHPKTRHDLENSFVLCRACHMFWHDRPVESSHWYLEAFGQRNYNLLKAMAGSPGRANHALTRLYLEQEAKKYGITPEPERG